MPFRDLCRPLFALCALTFVAGCLEAPEGGQGATPFAVFSTVSRPVGDPLPQAPIAGGDILVRGPDGYCVEGRSLRNRASGGFALLASCHVMTGGKQGIRVTPAVLTVSAAKAEGAPQVPGRAALAKVFAPTPVLADASVRDVTLVQLSEGGQDAVPGADPRHWRGAMALNGYMVSLALYAPEGSHVAGKGGSALLVEFAEALRRHKPVERIAADEAGEEKTATANRGGLLGALFQ